MPFIPKSQTLNHHFHDHLLVVCLVINQKWKNKLPISLGWVWRSFLTNAYYSCNTAITSVQMTADWFQEVINCRWWPWQGPAVLTACCPPPLPAPTCPYLLPPQERSSLLPLQLPWIPGDAPTLSRPSGALPLGLWCL